MGAYQADMQKPNWEGIRSSHYGLDFFNNQEDTSIKLPYNPFGSQRSQKSLKQTTNIQKFVKRPNQDKLIRDSLKWREKDFVDNKTQVYGALSSSNINMTSADGSKIKSITLNHSNPEETSAKDLALRRGFI